MDSMDDVIDAVHKVIKEWNDTFASTQKLVNAIEKCGSQGKVLEEAGSLPRLNGAARDGLTALKLLQSRLEILVPQISSNEEKDFAQRTLRDWKIQCLSLNTAVRHANLQAKANIRNAAQKERELLFGGGEESTTRRRNLQTRAGMLSAAEDVTDSLRRTRQLMVQEVERGASTQLTFEESTGVLKRAEAEYKGHRSLLTQARNLLKKMSNQDVLDRVIISLGFFLFLLAVLFVVSRRIGLLKLQRAFTAAVKSGHMDIRDIMNGSRLLDDTDGTSNGNMAPKNFSNMHDEL